MERREGPAKDVAPSFAEGKSHLGVVAVREPGWRVVVGPQVSPQQTEERVHRYCIRNGGVGEQPSHRLEAPGFGVPHETISAPDGPKAS